MAEEQNPMDSPEAGTLAGDDIFDPATGTVANDTVGGAGIGQEYSDGTLDQMIENVKSSGKGYTKYSDKPIGWNPYDSDRILGLPLYYNDLADPNGRVYNTTILYDLPVVHMLPGTMSVNRNLMDIAGKRISPAWLSNKLLDLTQNPSLPFAGIRGLAGGNDLRFIGFKPDYSEYFLYVQTMLSAVYSLMGKDNVFDIFNFSDLFKTDVNNYGLSFYLDKSSSISESADNTYTSSQVAEMANQKGQTAREADLLYPTGGNTARFVDSIKAMNPLGVLEALGTFDGIITRTSNALFRVVNGSQLLFPDFWQDSRYDKSYNLSFKFYSPYGDKMSIFRYVYVPFIALLALALPRQDGLLGYTLPFYVRMSKPGHFDVDMGVVTSMSITRGGADNLWTVEGFPQMIEVNMNVVDLYPQLTQIKNDGLFAYNLGISSFLQNMAGIRPDHMSFMKLGALVNRKLSNSLLFNVDEIIVNEAKDLVYDLQSRVNNLFGR